MAALGAVALFAVSVGPWYLRQLAVFGSLSPSTASGKVLFIRDIGEWNSITTPATLDHLLGMGIGPLLLSRLGGLVAALFIFSVLVGVLVLVPFMVAGAWRRRGDATFGPFLGYAVLLFAFSAIVSAVHVPGRDVHPLRGGAGAARVRARARRDRGRASPGSRPAGAAGTWRRRRACSWVARSRSASLAAVVRRDSPSMPPGTTSASGCRRWAPRSTRPAPRHRTG